jgi:restriction system protein
VILTPEGKDGGKDIVVEDTSIRRLYYVEIKHWRSGKVVGSRLIRDFSNILLRDGIKRGLYLSTSGYTEQVYQSFPGEWHPPIDVEGRGHIQKLCRNFKKALSGDWVLPNHPSDFVFALEPELA